MTERPGQSFRAPIDRQRERDLAARAQCGDRAAAGELIQAHEGYLRKVVGQFGDPDDEDMMQEARIAALDSLASFDLSRGTRLLTYVGWRVRWAMLYYAAENRLIRTPTREHYNRISPAAQRRAEAARQVLPMDAPLPNGQRVGSLMGRDDDPTEKVELADELRKLDRVLLTLPPRDHDVITRHAKGETLEAIGRAVGLTKARVGQIVHNTLQRLRWRMLAA